MFYKIVMANNIGVLYTQQFTRWKLRIKFVFLYKYAVSWETKIGHATFSFVLATNHIVGFVPFKFS